MNGPTRALAATLLGALLAACSGVMNADGVGPRVSPARASNWHGKVGHIHIRLLLPTKQHEAQLRAAIRRTTKARGKKPGFLPSSAASVAFTLAAVNGGTPPSGFNFTLQTPACTPEPSVNPTGYLCTALVPAPVGADVWTIVAADGSSHAVSEANVTITVTSASAAPTSFTLDPVVGELAWTTLGYPNGIDTPKWTGSAYTCVDPPDGGCYDPLLNTIDEPNADSAALDVLDADGNVVIPAAGSAPVSGAPYVPIYYTVDGAEDEIGVLCEDPDTEYLAAGVTAPVASPVPQSDFANGSQNGVQSGSGNAVAFDDFGTTIAFNSPVTGQDTATAGQGTDFTGTPIADGIYGNNGGFMNYDGASAAMYGPGVVDTCTAVDSQGLIATYSIGLAEGLIGWSADGRHRAVPHSRANGGIVR